MNRRQILERLGADVADSFRALDLERVRRDGAVTHTIESAAGRHGRVVRRREPAGDDHTRVVYTLETTAGDVLYRTGHPKHLLSEGTLERVAAVTYWSERRESYLGATRIDPGREALF